MLIESNIPANDKNAIELSVMSDIVIAYEKEYFPIPKPTVAELLESSLAEKSMPNTQHSTNCYVGNVIMKER